jgi:hypothetical protein
MILLQRVLHPAKCIIPMGILLYAGIIPELFLWVLFLGVYYVRVYYCENKRDCEMKIVKKQARVSSIKINSKKPRITPTVRNNKIVKSRVVRL